jgi:hypothetical protein
LVLAEILGQWPETIGIILICLIPKSDGGRRPIGLLPSVVRWWMRIRLDVVRTWQAANERPFFYAGPRKGAEVAAWKHAARSELAQTQSAIDYAALLLDLVKAFERVPHEWLLAQGVRFQYPLLVLRLSIQAYRLCRTVVVDGLCSPLLRASRGITAGAVHATVELRLLLIEGMSRASLVMYVTITLYVDDATLEAIGPAPVVRRALVVAARIFTGALHEMGMEFSPTKNVCVASTPALADSIVGSLPGLALKTARAAKALGGAISGGKVRNTAVLRKRLEAFRVRKTCFRKLRRAVGARRCHAVLRSGGTSALMYGIANTGVATSTLAMQRSAVALASVSSGSSDVDLALVIADGSLKGKADPAFQAHISPIGKWAEAVWESWLSRPALEKLATAARVKVGKPNFRWTSVRGPAAAFVASAVRLGWDVLDAYNVVTDWGASIDFRVDPPAYAVQLVTESVWRWRWRLVEAKLPHLTQGSGGHGPFIEPVLKLLAAQPTATWDAKHQGALRSALANRQWTQVRLHMAGLVSTRNCQLCVAFGLCDPQDPHPQWAGHAVHRCYTCRVTQAYREEHAPKWLLCKVASLLDEQWLIPSAQVALYTRALAPHPRPRLKSRPVQEKFEWVMRPPDGMVRGEVFVDGSRLYAEHDLFGMCARIGYAFAIYDDAQNLVAAARGVPPSWVQGIHGAELFGLLESSLAAMPGSNFLSDCRSVVKGCGNSEAWATAPTRRFARAWAPLLQALDGSQVLWMPAHLSSAQNLQAALRRSEVVLADGRTLTRHMVLANAFVDKHAKIGANTFRPLPSDVSLVRDEAARIKDIARWVGMATAFANHHPAPDVLPPGAKVAYMRDSEAARPCGSSSVRKAKEAVVKDVALVVDASEAPPPAVVVSDPQPSGSARRKLSPLVRTGEMVRCSSAVAKGKAAVRALQDGDELRLQDWLESRPATSLPQSSASQRLQALRERLNDKFRPCGCRVLSPQCHCA